MTKTKILKGFALLNFIGLITLFLFFRNGAFDNYFLSEIKNTLTSPNGGTQVKVINDSLSRKNDSLRLQRLSSSKSMVIIDNINLKKDTTKIPKDSIKVNLIELDRSLMHGSKSGIIFDPIKFKQDSLKAKPERTKKKKKA